MPSDSTNLHCLWNAKELATKLRLHPETIKRLAREKKIPCVRVGQSVRFDLDAVMKKLESTIS